MLVDLFGIEENFAKLKKKRNGQKIEFFFKNEGYSMTITNVSTCKEFNAEAKAAKDPVAKLTFNIEFKKALKVIAKVINTKRTFMGLVSVGLFLLPKLITKKAEVDGSLIGAVAGLRAMMFGKSPHYKEIY